MAIPVWRVKLPAASSTRSARAGKNRASASASASAFFPTTDAACRIYWRRRIGSFIRGNEGRAGGFHLRGRGELVGLLDGAKKRRQEAGATGRAPMERGRGPRPCRRR